MGEEQWESVTEGRNEWESVIRVCLYDGDEFGGERRDERERQIHQRRRAEDVRRLFESETEVRTEQSKDGTVSAEDCPLVDRAPRARQFGREPLREHLARLCVEPAGELTLTR
tara:strand:- start:389 stop:727 length:339 start_codon:yes stop_codon:yes gene_type:complete